MKVNGGLGALSKGASIASFALALFMELSKNNGGAGNGPGSASMDGKGGGRIQCSPGNVPHINAKTGDMHCD